MRLSVLLIAHRTVTEPKPKPFLYGTVEVIFDSIDQKAYEWVLLERFEHGFAELRMQLGLLDLPRKHQALFDSVIDDLTSAKLIALETFQQAPSLTRQVPHKGQHDRLREGVESHVEFEPIRHTWGDPSHFAVTLLVLPKD
jgi:hypothetical protein